MFARQAHVPAHDQICIPHVWPFTCWGLDQVGPLKKAKGGLEYIFIAIKKFTKWIEYKPLVKYSAAKAVEFIQDIMHRFGIPNRVITDLGSPFIAIEFINWTQDYGINIDYASVAHPEANGQVERANRLILARLKPRLYEELEDYSSKWIEELPMVVWGLCTQVSKATRYSPFFLVYGSEAVLPVDLIWTSQKIKQYEEGEAEHTRRLELDSIEEVRVNATLQSARYLQGLRHHYNKSTQQCSVQVGDLVL
jgi:transposase InsO family protein